MALAEYRTERNAKRYANEINAKFPQHHAVAMANGFRYGVLVTVNRPDGSFRNVWAAKRPRNYAKR